MIARDAVEQLDAISGRIAQVDHRVHRTRLELGGGRGRGRDALRLELRHRGGAHGIKTGDAVERAYRDVGAGVTHVGCDWDVWGRVYGLALLGQGIAIPNFGFFPAEVVKQR